MTLLAIFIFPTIFFFSHPLPLSHFRNHNLGQTPIERTPVLGDIDVPSNLSIYIGCVTHVLSFAAPQNSIGRYAKIKADLEIPNLSNFSSYFNNIAEKIEKKLRTIYAISMQFDQNA